MALQLVDDAAALPRPLRGFLDGTSQADTELDPSLVTDWLATVDDAIATAQLVHDVVRDRFVLPREQMVASPGWPAPRRQETPPPPRDLTERALALIHKLTPDFSLDDLLVLKLTSDPLMWLASFCDPLVQAGDAKSTEG